MKREGENEEEKAEEVWGSSFLLLLESLSFWLFYDVLFYMTTTMRMRELTAFGRK